MIHSVKSEASFTEVCAVIIYLVTNHSQEIRMSTIDGTETFWWRWVAMGTAAKQEPKQSSKEERES